jgi:uncharacterized protein YbaA (DUF1428 family)
MARYVDGFVLPVPKKKVPEYVRMARKAGKVWMEHGAVAFMECAGDDLASPMSMTFPKLAKLKPGETVFYSFIVFNSRTHRDRVNKKVMADPRLNEMMQGRAMPFDVKRMAYGGFKSMVDLK